MSKKNHRFAIVLSGGGARGAYEAGVIHYLRTGLKDKEGSKTTFRIQGGSSVGALNSCVLAATAHSGKLQGQAIYDIWKNIRPDQVYKRDFSALTRLVAKTTKGVSSNFLHLNPFSKGKKGNSHFTSILDTAPLSEEVLKKIPFKQITLNIQKGVLDALSLTATNISTGRMELFIQKRPEIPYTGHYDHHFCQIKPEHALASAAIPVIFPPVKIGNTFYTDGGLRLNTPMSPAIQLGADRIFMIGLHHQYQPGEKYRYTSAPHEHPSLGQLIGLIMNALFTDRNQYDIEQLTRINRIIEWSQKVFGPNYIDKINEMLAKDGIKGDIADRGLKHIKVLSINPSQDISDMFAQCFAKSQKNKNTLTTFEKVLFKVLDIDPSAGVDILSYLSFIPNYIQKLIELGFHDAKARRDEIIEFLTN